MTPEAQRIAIAGACGWKLNPAKHTAKATDWLHAASGNTAYGPPDYLNSLDAMHEAEKAQIIPLDSSAFYDALQEIMGRDLQRNITGDGIGFSGWIAHATADQRAEAFLRTLNLWTE